jgi:hypothetical protein
MRLSLNKFIWKSHQYAWGTELKNQSTNSRYKVRENLVFKRSF